MYEFWKTKRGERMKETKIPKLVILNDTTIFKESKCMGIAK